MHAPLLDRRSLLVPRTQATAVLGAAPRRPVPVRDALVSIFLRGGMDGLSAVVPHGEAAYYGLRPTLAIPPPSAPGGALDLDGFFGLAPAGAPLLEAWQRRELLLVHATGSTDPTRSHFEAMRVVETAGPNQPRPLGSGWLARHLQSAPSSGQGPFRALAFGSLMPAILDGSPGAVPTTDPAQFDFPGGAVGAAARRAAIESMFARAPQPLPTSMEASLDATDRLAEVDLAGYVPGNGAVYPDDPFGSSLLRTAAILKAGIGVEAVHIDLGGWDHHDAQGPLDGSFAYLFASLAGGLAAFARDTRGMRVTTVAMSEFGRRADENGSEGTDHGQGGVMLVLGAGIAGGRVLTDWPTLAPAALDEDALRTTIDCRDVLSELVRRRLGNPELGHVFPGYTPNFRGVTL